jgi:hypothetical protein
MWKMLAQPVLFKITGAFALLGGGAYAAYTESARDRARLYRMDCLIALVKQLRTKIERYLTPVGEILRQCDAEVIKGCFTGVDSLPRERPRDVGELVFQIRRGTYFEDGKDALCALAERLGRSYREDSVRECDECVRELEAVRATLASELPKKRKTRAVMGLCAAAAAVIVII